MFGKKLFLLLGGYVAGNLVATLYTSKKGKEIKTEMKKAKKDGKDEVSIVFENLFDIQKRFFDDIQSFIQSEKNKKLLGSKVENAKEYVEIFKNKSQFLIEEFQKKWIGKTSQELKKRLEVLYSESKNHIMEHFDGISQESLDEMKKKLQSSFEEVKKLLKK